MQHAHIDDLIIGDIVRRNESVGRQNRLKRAVCVRVLSLRRCILRRVVFSLIVAQVQRQQQLGQVQSPRLLCSLARSRILLVDDLSSLFALVAATRRNDNDDAQHEESIRLRARARRCH